MSLRTRIQKSIEKAAPGIDVTVEVPQRPEHGDYATNAAFLLTQKSISSKDAAQNLVQNIDSALFEKIDIAGAGFINFFLKKELLYGELETIRKEKLSYGTGEKKQKKIQVECISANPTGPITLGNGRGAFLGDTLARALKHAGFTVETEYYVNDAKASKQISDLGKTALGEESAYPYIEELYLQEHPNIKKEIEGMTAAEAGHTLAQFIQKENEKTLQDIGIHTDVFFHEQELFDKKKVRAAVDLLKKHNLDYEKDGALWLRTSAHGDTEDRVIIRNTGEPTYFLTDLAYHLNKFTDRKFNTVIDIWGADHHGYAPRLQAALRALGIRDEQFRVIITQLVRLTENGKEVRMSKRTGQFETLADFVNDIGIDAARYFFLEKSPDTHMDFDLGIAREHSAKNPVYYIQYAHARIASILNEAQSQKHPDYALLTEQKELALIKHMAQFPDVIEDAARTFQVHHIPRYAYELAHAFHDFYEEHHVIQENKELEAARAALVEGVQTVLQNTLHILGIHAPEHM